MTAEQLLEDYFTEEEMAKILGVGIGRLRNKICAGKDHPPFVGRGKGRRFPKDAFKRWEKEQLIHQKNK